VRNAAGSPFASALYPSRLVHRRLRPVRHEFGYGVTPMLLDLDELPRLDRELPLFSHNGPNVVSFHDRDHGPKDGSPLRPWVDGLLRDAGIGRGGPVRILCLPRVYGYVFNPLTEWFCHDEGGRLTAILHEVRNTFGEWHGYLIPVDPRPRAGEPILQRCDKVFHVSPFMEMDLEYRFRIVAPGPRAAIGMRVLDADGVLFTASLAGRRVPLSNSTLASSLAAHPLTTAKVTAGIHRQALTLWRKGVPFRGKVGGPGHTVDVVGAEAATVPWPGSPASSGPAHRSTAVR
jgi:uncharacterized protein